MKIGKECKSRMVVIKISLMKTPDNFRRRKRRGESAISRKGDQNLEDPESPHCELSGAINGRCEGKQNEVLEESKTEAAVISIL